MYGDLEKTQFRILMTYVYKQRIVDTVTYGPYDSYTAAKAQAEAKYMTAPVGVDVTYRIEKSLISWRAVE